MKRIALTGGIACGKSTVGRLLNEYGVETIDADDVVHELLPEEERRRLAKVVFADPEKRKELEKRLHPLVKERIRAFLDEKRGEKVALAIIPLLFEAHWDSEYDIICCVSSERATQISRMMANRGYTLSEAEARIAAQMPVREKADKSHYVIRNEGSEEDLRKEVERFLTWLKNSMCLPLR